MGELDLHLLGEGRHYRAFERLGSHALKIGSATGTYFAVWAPNAERVSLVGDFNQWHGLGPSDAPPRAERHLGTVRSRPRRRRALQVQLRGGFDRTPFLKADPYAREFETPPATAALTSGVPQYRWRDDDWVTAREASNGNLCRARCRSTKCTSRRGRGSPRTATAHSAYRELGERLVPYVKDMGFTHIELLPVLEHPFGGSWGYQVTGFFAPTSRHGSPDDFRWFVDECHRHGIGVILDWVPGHFRRTRTASPASTAPRSTSTKTRGWASTRTGARSSSTTAATRSPTSSSRARCSGSSSSTSTACASTRSRRCSTWITRARPASGCRSRFGGRENIEAVAFLRHLNEIVHAEHPGVMMIAEESTAWPAVSRPVYAGGLGFTFKWNMGWMHRTS